MRNILALFILNIFLLNTLTSQIFIDHLDNPCPTADILTVCLGDNNSYEGQYMFRTYDSFCSEDEIVGETRIYRNFLGEYFIEDFSFGTWPECYGIDPPTGTLRLNIDCNEVLGMSGTDNYGDVWGSNEVIYTGTSIIINWFNSYPEFGTTELTPLDGNPIADPLEFLESDYTFEWNTGETAQSIEVAEPGRYTVQVRGPNGFSATETITIDEDEYNFEPECSGEILDVRYFMDDNRNGIRDAGETTVLTGEKYIRFIPDYQLFAFQGNDTERYVLEAGSHLIGMDNDDFESANLPMAYEAVQDQDVDNIEIGLYAKRDFEELSVDISSAAIERCNTVVPFKVRLRNTGTLPFNNEFKLKMHPALEYVSATPEPVSVDPEYLSWDVSIENHGQELSIDLLLKMPPVEFLDVELCLEPEIGSFEKSSDDFCFEISCAYDPNDKIGTPFRGDRNLTLFEEELKYTIRFENLGNDTAFDIRVEDWLANGFDLDSYRFIQSSHEVSRQFITQERRLVFIFDDIQLPSIEQDSINNKGFVQFAIKSIPGLPEEYTLQNTAEIFFDFNDAIVTNETRHTLVTDFGTSSIVDGLLSESMIEKLFPNPARDRLNVITRANISGNCNYMIYDSSGRLLMSDKLSRQYIDISALEEGLYFLQLTSGSERSELIRFARL